MSQRHGPLPVTPFTLPSPAWRVMVYGILLTLLLFGAVRHLESHETDHAFQGHVSQQIATLRNDLNEITDRLRHARDVLMEAEPFQESVFNFVANHLLTEQPYAQHVTFRRIVSHEDRKAYETRMQQKYPGFQITELENEQHVPAKERLHYHVLEHIAPAETGIFIRGLDAVSLDAEDDAISRAMSTGLPAATALYPQDEVTLPIHQNSITLILPVYDSPQYEEGATAYYPEQIGEIAVTLNAAGLFRELLARSSLLHQSGIGIEISTGSSHGKFISLLKTGFPADSEDEDPSVFRRLLLDQPEASRHTLWLGGQPWYIVVSRQPQLLIRHRHLSLTILLGGLLLSVIAALCVQRSTAYTKHVEHLITKRTAALERSNRRLRKHILRRKDLEKALHANQKRFTHFTRISSDWHWETDTEHRFTMGADKYGVDESRMLGTRIWEFPVMDQTSSDWDEYRRKISSRQPIVDFEYRVRYAAGVYRWYASNAQPFYDEDGNFCGYRGTSRDITDHKNASLAVKKSEESIRRLLVHKEKVREEERKRIAREIHDDLGQYLLVMRYDLTSLISAHAAPDERLLQLSEKLDAATTSLRRIINNLRPPVLDHGLRAALEWQCKQFQKQHDTLCHLSWETTLDVVDEAASISLFRITQESLSNVARHAQATEVHVRIWTDQDSLYLQVRDNGKGIGSHKAGKPESFGLLGMKERVKNLGGHLCFNSIAGQGSTLSVSLPLGPNTAPVSSAPATEATENLIEQAAYFDPEHQYLLQSTNHTMQTDQKLQH